MLSKKFLAWVGVGVLSAVAIPALAAPHLAKMVQRHPAGVTAKTTPAKAAKPAAIAAKTATAAKPVAAIAGKTKTATATATPGRVHALHRAHATAKLHTGKQTASTVAAKKRPAPVTTAAKSASKSTVTPKSFTKPAALKSTTPKVTTASTAKKLLH